METVSIAQAGHSSSPTGETQCSSGSGLHQTPLFPGALGAQVRALCAGASSKRQDSEVLTGSGGGSQLPSSSRQAKARVPHPSGFWHSLLVQGELLAQHHVGSGVQINFILSGHLLSCQPRYLLDPPAPLRRAFADLQCEIVSPTDPQRACPCFSPCHLRHTANSCPTPAREGNSHPGCEP